MLCAYSYAMRLGGTFIGALVGMVGWYIGKWHMYVAQERNLNDRGLLLYVRIWTWSW